MLQVLKVTLEMLVHLVLLDALDFKVLLGQLGQKVSVVKLVLVVLLEAWV